MTDHGAHTTYRPGEPIPGTQYVFVRLLGAGGHGEVYEVEHTFLQARAVMKLLHGHLVDREELAQRMTREARTLAKLRHPNIVEVRDGGITGETPPRPYFVMEALSGVSLRELLRQIRGGVGAQAALRIVTGVLDGLQHAHRAGVIHRDIKPDNIFLHRTNTDVTVAKVLDFGIAHLLLGRRVTGRAFLGTPRYAAPEQLRGEPPTETTDVYAAGLVLFELLTGKAPFADRRAIGDLVQAHFHESLPAPSTLGRDVPPVVDRLVAMFTAKNPAERPPNAFAAAVMLRELRSHIEALAAGTLDAPDFRTEPSPMDDALFSVVPNDDGLITELPSSSKLPVAAPAAHGASAEAPNDTVPSAPPLFRTEPMAAPVCVDGDERTPLDRNAATRTGKRDDALPVPRHDTLVEVPPALADTTPDAAVFVQTPARAASSVPSRAPIERRHASEPHAPSLPSRRPWRLFVVALGVFTIVGLPLAWRAVPTNKPRAEETPPAAASPSPVIEPARAIATSAPSVRGAVAAAVEPVRAAPSANASVSASPLPKKAAVPRPKPSAPGYDD